MVILWPPLCMSLLPPDAFWHGLAAMRRGRMPSGMGWPLCAEAECLLAWAGRYAPWLDTFWQGWPLCAVAGMPSGMAWPLCTVAGCPLAWLTALRRGRMPENSTAKATTYPFQRQFLSDSFLSPGLCAPIYTISGCVYLYILVLLSWPQDANITQPRETRCFPAPRKRALKSVHQGGKEYVQQLHR